MNILAIEASTSSSFVALRCAHGDYAETCREQRSHANFLLPAIERLLKVANVKASELDLILVGHGPGSFTGIRIAVSLAQGLAYGAKVLTLGTDSTFIFATALFNQVKKDLSLAQEKPAVSVLVALDARMGEAYLGLYSFDDSGIATESSELELVPVADLTSNVSKKADGVATLMLTGDAWTDEIKHTFQQTEHIRYLDLPEEQIPLAMLNIAEQNASEASSANNLQPMYVRSGINWQKRTRIRAG